MKRRTSALLNWKYGRKHGQKILISQRDYSMAALHIREKIYNMADFQPINFSINQILNYTLHLADNALILGQRN
ncbi:MAG: hypothetical protein ABJB86_05490, partial [Bacteroidota bacterium]